MVKSQGWWFLSAESLFTLSSQHVELLNMTRLFYPVNFAGVIQPICIPEKTFQVEAGTRCWVTGWGKQQEFSETVRQEVTLGRGRQLYPWSRQQH